MQNRTITDLHDKEIGHPKFAKAVGWLVKHGHVVTDIKEYYEKFIYKVDGIRLEYDKQNWKSTSEKYAIYVHNLLIDIKRSGLCN